MSARREVAVRGLDGIIRPAALERHLNDLFAAVFADGGGEQVLTYLKNITLHRVSDEGIRSEDLHQREGARRLVAMIIGRIEHGRNQRAG